MGSDQPPWAAGEFNHFTSFFDLRTRLKYPVSSGGLTMFGIPESVTVEQEIFKRSIFRNFWERLTGNLCA